MIIAGTGHRSIPFSEQHLIRAITGEICLLGPSRVISGMALGWDMALADAAVRIGVPFVAAVPFSAQPDRWPRDQIARYERLLGLAAEVVVLSEYTALSAYERRNRWMVDRADLVLAYWDGSLTGGTSNAVRYANKKRVPMLNMWGCV